jgi:hypothetical protein
MQSYPIKNKRLITKPFKSNRADSKTSAGNAKSKGAKLMSYVTDFSLNWNYLALEETLNVLMSF